MKIIKNFGPKPVRTALKCSLLLPLAATTATLMASDVRYDGAAPNPSANAAVDVRVMRATNFIGTDVMAGDHRKVGDIVDYVFDVGAPPRLAYVMVMTGGFLNLGGDLRAVPAAALTFDGDTAHIRPTRDQYFAIPKLTTDAVTYVSNRGNVTEVEREFNLPAATPASGANSSYILFSAMNGRDAYSAADGRLGVIDDAWISLNRERAPFVEITPMFRPFEPTRSERYALPVSRLRPDDNPSTYTFAVTIDELTKAKAASDTPGVAVVQSGFIGDQVLRIAVPAVASNTTRAARPARSGRGQRDSGRGFAITDRVQIAPDNASDWTVRHFAGQHLKSADGQDLGTIKDFAVDAATGQADWVVVSSGGFAGVGNTLRLVPIHALRPTSDNDGFTINLDEARWKQMAKLDEASFEDNLLSVSAANRAEWQQFTRGRDAADHRNDSSQATSGTTNNRYVRASTLRGKSVRNGSGKVGDIEDIIVNPRRGMAAALLDASVADTGSGNKFLVPLKQFDLGSSASDPINTQLTQADLQRATIGQDTAARPVERSGAPTGREDAGNWDASSSAAAAAHSVRQALDKDTSLRSENLQVVPQGDKILLRGSVTNSTTRGNAEEAAERAAPGVDIENEITISSQ